jgi:hypothetical protein
MLVFDFTPWTTEGPGFSHGGSGLAATGAPNQCGARTFPRKRRGCTPLKGRRLRGKYVAYCGDERIGIATDDEPLILKCVARGRKREEYDILVIEPQSEEPEELEVPAYWAET